MNQTLPTPQSLHISYPVNKDSKLFLNRISSELSAILTGLSLKKLFIIGPCSIHHFEGAISYAQQFLKLQKQVFPEILLLMRVHIEKPRTKDDWRGFVYDPSLDQSNNLLEGIYKSRLLMTTLIEMGVPIALEILDPNLVPYFEDCYSFVTIGARTIASPTHRLIASDVTCPVGYKNRIDGDISSAIEAFKIARKSQQILRIDDLGRLQTKKTLGNKLGCIILRGAQKAPNYDLNSIESTKKLLKLNDLPCNILIDCAHGNSTNESQDLVFEKMADLMLKKEDEIQGILLESYLRSGKFQGKELTKAPFDQSITDPCLSFEQTSDMILKFHSKLIKSNHNRCLKLATSSPSNVVRSAL